MAVTAHTYTKAAETLANKEMDFDTDVIKCMLLSAYTVGTTQDTAKYLGDVLSAGTEASGTGYTATGVALTGLAISTTGRVTKLTGTIPAWNTTGGTLAAAYAVFYDSTPASNATRPVLCFWDLGGTQTSSNGNFTLTVDSAGLVTLTGS